MEKFSKKPKNILGILGIAILAVGLIGAYASFFDKFLISLKL